jgi:hypothetical protein
MPERRHSARGAPRPPLGNSAVSRWELTSSVSNGRPESVSRSPTEPGITASAKCTRRAPVPAAALPGASLGPMARVWFRHFYREEERVAHDRVGVSQPAVVRRRFSEADGKPLCRAVGGKRITAIIAAVDDVVTCPRESHGVATARWTQSATPRRKSSQVLSPTEGALSCVLLGRLLRVAIFGRSKSSQAIMDTKCYA